jgi:N-methylhydantoinase A
MRVAAAPSCGAEWTSAASPSGTVGAGGGSLVWRDRGGALRVGPQSAGALPGPACYGRGGTEPTVTDANLLLGRLPAVLPGALELDRDAAARALGGIEPAAVVEVVNAEMLRALRVVSVERGLDPRGFALVAYGGAGPLHACALAEELGIEAVLVPAAAGVLSALGLAAGDGATRPARASSRSRRRARCRPTPSSTSATRASRTS